MIKSIHKSIHGFRYSVLLAVACLSAGCSLSTRTIYGYGGEMFQVCRPIHVIGNNVVPSGGRQGMLWRVSKAGVEPSHVFGTIHVAGEVAEFALTRVGQLLEDSQFFVAETLPEREKAGQMWEIMSFPEGEEYLYNFVPPVIYQRTVEILSAYHIDEQKVAKLRPWGAYITMGYPPGMGKILDVRLYELAQQHGLQLQGLETPQELLEAFTDITLPQQAQLLTDGVCHYELTQERADMMIDRYLADDLRSIYLDSRRYYYKGRNSQYRKLGKRLLHDRNAKMIDRMLPALEQGRAFVAVGALHLPGKNGILASLQELGYKLDMLE
ncbi:MAG: TraB/GumN family protein [Gammaproteobacteria bacterium]